MLKEYNSTKNLLINLLRLPKESTVSIWAPLKKSKIKRNEKQQCKGSLCQRRQISSTRQTL